MAVITYDGTSSSGYKAATSSYSWLSHSVTTNKPSIFIVRVAIFVSGSVSSITLGGVNLSFLRAKANGVYRIETWYLTEPPTGVNTVSVTLSGSLTSSAVEVVYYNVNAISPFNDQQDNTGTANAASVTANPSSADPMIIGGLVTPTASGVTDNTNVGQTQRDEVNGALGSLVVSDLFDYALTTDGSQNYINCGTLGTFGSNLGSGFYCSFQIQTTSTQQGSFGVEHSSYSGINQVQIGFNGGANGTQTNHSMFFYLASNNYNYECFRYTSSPTINFNDGNIHTITISVNVPSQIVTLTIDGVSQSLNSSFSNGNTPNWVNFGDPFYLGAAYNGGPAIPLACTLDNFEMGTSSSAIYVSYAMNDGIGTSVADASGNTNTGTLEKGAGSYPTWVAGLSASEQLLWNGIGSLDTWASTGLTLNESTVVPVQSKYNMLMMGI